MTYERNGLTITLETEDEIMTFWNIISFALDFEAEHNGRLTKNEIDLAKKLQKLTEKDYSI